MAQQLRFLVHDPGVISNTHVVACNQPNILLQGTWCPFLASAITRHMWCTYINAEKNHTHEIKKLKIDMFWQTYGETSQLLGMYISSAIMQNNMTGFEELKT